MATAAATGNGQISRLPSLTPVLPAADVAWGNRASGDGSPGAHALFLRELRRQAIVKFARNRNVGSKPSFYGDATPAGAALPRPIRRAATSPTTSAVRLVLCITLSG